jgi:2-haloacid dehalogenase
MGVCSDYRPRFGCCLSDCCLDSGRAKRYTCHMKSAVRGVKALTFDVFGTVVDWRGSIVREGAVWGREKGLDVDWGKFADLWRAGYKPSLDRVRRGDLPWTKLDVLHRKLLDGLLEEFRIIGLSEEEKAYWNRVWHRLDPWPDAVEGLTRLKEKFTIATLSNGDFSLLVDIAKHAALPWDAIISSELFRRYKPDRENYLGAADLLGCKPLEVIMVAAHPSDLNAARECGLKTAFVSRPLEHGAEHRASVAATADSSAPAWDITATDFLDLAAQLA